ncbi:hypothetical protein BC351_00270 [Paenibacillus ferrarius]|uniref:Phage tail protein n=1 Tax=Paenibacillus ferrarius TaxID=1469647 RepID=A0A1V4HSB5_9BACL|nr:phage tail domain-containing protein [Paenibacillus ferrarius]OPH61712.1 hypothetical protein BC351_00270 [Paenibacillus ferrarius]
MIRQSKNFTFNGESNDAYGIISVNLSTGMQSEPFGASTTIKEVEIRGNSKRYFQGVQRSPLEFTVTFAFSNAFTSDELRSVSRWLTTDFYAPLQFYDGTGEDLKQIYYVMFVDTPELVTNAANHGYVTLKAHCNDAYAYSSIYSDIVDCSTNIPEGTKYTFQNLGDVSCSPIIEVQIVSGSSFAITNYSNGTSKVLSFTGLSVGEILKINCENEVIESSTESLRYDNMTTNSVFFTFPTGANYLNITGNVQVCWNYEHKFNVG